VVWGESSSTNAQLSLFLAISSYPKNLWFFITSLHHCRWNQLVYQWWIWELDWEPYLHLPWNHKHIKDWMEALFHKL
jgi:hypothetical protein